MARTSAQELQSLIQSQDRSVYLKDYSYDKLAKDIKGGKLKREIAKELYNKNPKYYDKLPRLKDAAGRPIDIITTISTAITSRVRNRPELKTIDASNIDKFKNLKQTALKDVRGFINKNKNSYKKFYGSKTVGAVDSFKEKILDYASKKYPDLVERSKGSGKNLIANQRIFTPYTSIGREVTGAGEYGLEKALRKDIRKALDIAERPAKGEGISLDRMRRNYNSDLTKNLKEAQKLGKVPKIDPVTKKAINNADAYYRYVDRKEIDPVRKLFGGNYKFGQEHVGGVARAALINDVDSLNKITAMDPSVNRFVKGADVDKKITTLMRLAKQSNPIKAKEYLKKINELSEVSDAQYGLSSTRYKLVNNEIKPIQPKGSDKFKKAVKTFTATKRYKDPNFKLLDKDLQNSVNALKKGDTIKSDQFLKTAVDKFIKQVKSVPGGCRAVVTKALGGPIDSCAAIINADPERAAAKLTQSITATKGPLKNLKDSSQELKAIFAQPDRAPTGLVNSFSGQIRPALPNVQYNDVTGVVTNTATGNKATAADMKNFEVENPLKTVAGTEDAYKPIKKNFLNTVKKSLLKVGAPLPTAVIDSYFIGKQIQDDKSALDIAKNPLNWLGLATMSSATKAATRLGGGSALSGILRLGLSLPVIAGVSKIATVAGLGALAYGAYDQYNKYKENEGLVYNFFNNSSQEIE